MIRGLRFQIENKYQNFFADILEGIDIEKYSWYISENQVFTKTADFFFYKDEYTGTEFKKIIDKHQDDYYIVFVTVKAGDKTNFEIQNYFDFIKSNYNFVIICSDSEFINIYCKNKKDIDILKVNAQNKKYSKIENITDENDLRVNFCAI